MVRGLDAATRLQEDSTCQFCPLLFSTAYEPKCFRASLYLTNWHD